MTTIRASASRGARLGKLAYGALFLALLPLALVLWANRLDTWVPLVRLQSVPLGALIAVAGAGLMAHAMAVLWSDGGGLPASPYPPERLVTSGPYRLFAHPIYVGAVAVALGVALAFGSPGGVWIVTPTLAAAATAWVWGFERDATMRRFGRLATPLMSLASIPLLAAPLGARWQRRLREFALQSLWAAAVVLTLELLLPLSGSYHLVWVAALALFLVVLARRGLWRHALDVAERIANSWREWRVGPVRLLSHGIYAGAGAGLGVAVATAIAGTSQIGWIVALTAAAIVGAGVWAQLVEGSSQLLRPYGYFGAVLGVLLVLAAAALAGVDLWATAGAFCVGSTVTYAAGRMRCLVQGCCHGSPAPPALGIVYRDPHSRVCRLSMFGGIPLHPTPLYSALWMLLVGAVLLRLWSLAAPLPFIVGSYFILTGLGRFVEEHYRGEPQTLVIAGMRLYQWLAIGLLVLGSLVTCMDGPRAAAFAGFDLSTLPTLLFVTAAACVAYGVDFPRSDWRFSRLV